MFRIEPGTKSIDNSFKITSRNKVARDMKDLYNNIFKTENFTVKKLKKIEDMISRTNAMNMALLS